MGNKIKKREHKPPIDKSLIPVYFEKGWTDVQIAHQLGVSDTHIRNIRSKLGLIRAAPSNQQRVAESEDILWLKKIREQEKRRPSRVLTMSTLALIE